MKSFEAGEMLGMLGIVCQSSLSVQGEGAVRNQVKEVVEDQSYPVTANNAEVIIFYRNLAKGHYSSKVSSYN